MKTPSLVIAAFVLGTTALSGLACNHAGGDGDHPASPEVETADVAALAATRQLAFAETYAAAAANLRASLVELRGTPRKESAETIAAVVKKLAELEGLAVSMRALAAQSQAQVRSSR